MGRSQHFDALVAAGRSYLEQHGVKGMKWGVRKDRSGGVARGETLVTQKKPGGKLTVMGGKHVPAHEDAIRAASSKQRAKGSGTHALGNKELQDLVTRLNLEKQYGTLTSTNGSTIAAGKKVVSGILGNVAKQQITRLANDEATKRINKQFNKS